VAKKRYDPLWELVNEKVPLQGTAPDHDAHCPHCNVTLHIGREIKPGRKIECGLCGGTSEVLEEDGKVLLRPAAD
jgi:hypothetical protein